MSTAVPARQTGTTIDAARNAFASGDIAATERICAEILARDANEWAAWALLTETTLDKAFKPTFPKYLKELDGKRVALTGYMQPLGEDTDLGAFLLIEHPVGCWYCEMPDLAAIVLVELPEGKAGRLTREAIRVTGKLELNATDPENFLYTVKDARVGEPE